MGPSQHNTAISFAFNIHALEETNSDVGPVLTKSMEVLGVSVRCY